MGPERSLLSKWSPMRDLTRKAVKLLKLLNSYPGMLFLEGAEHLRTLNFELPNGDDGVGV
eukprot:5699062-Ditylum_brightwellii.AAC.1